MGLLADGPAGRAAGEDNDVKQYNRNPEKILFHSASFARHSVDAEWRLRRPFTRHP